MSWTHSICIPCWEEREPGRMPIVTNSTVMETCCFCGEHTSDGIYVREDPANVGFCPEKTFLKGEE